MSNSILQTKSHKFQETVKNASLTPGVYKYYDTFGKVIYVGKAKVLKNRVNSYFTNFLKLEPRIQQMIVQAQKIELTEVDTEFEALILETNLIKKYKPKYNILMRDDKNYLYVRFERIRKSNQPEPSKYSVYQDFPRITIVRNKKNDKAEYFGPYPSKVPLSRVLKRLRRVFPYRTSEHLVIQKSENPLIVQTSAKRPCFYYHLGLCMGACAGLESRKEYSIRYNNIRKFFKGEKTSILNELENTMKKFSKELNFEEAAKLRDKIEDIRFVTSHITIDSEVDDVVVEQMKLNSRDNALDELIAQLKIPALNLKKHNLFRIECYDISNIQGTNSTGSMVVQIDGIAAPNLYRRFKIKTLDTPNDFEMLKEVLARRFAQLLKSNEEKLSIVKNFDAVLSRKVKTWKIDESFSQIPDLIIIDGGKGQLSSAYEVLKLFELDKLIPIVGLAKRQEEIFKIRRQFKAQTDSAKELVENKFERILLPRKSESLYLVQRIRDEAHRFAKSYHTKLRNKNLLKKVGD